MKKRTICHMIDFGGIGPGSFIPLLASLAAVARARGDRFVTLAREVPGETWSQLLRSAGAELHFSRERSTLYRRLWALNPDIVHTHFSGFDIGALLYGKTSRIFWHAHSVREPRTTMDVSKVRAFIKNRLLSVRVEKIVAPSETLRHELISWFVPEIRIAVVLNSVDATHFRPPTAQERARERSALGIGERDRVILFFERVPIKGGETLRNALTKVRDVRLLVVGGTAAMRERFGTAPNVIALDYVSDVRGLYWAADALAFPSRNEAFGFALAEALCCNLPVAATDIPVVSEITRGLDGIEVVAVDDSNALGSALLRALERGPTHNASAMAERFGLERWSREIYRLYDRT